ncbi:MAG: hypothetical protein II540_00555 [Paludibacteraceae bacterium]|nr:hypothetical protein [Paludibacteraceae bacterium]
MAKVEWSTGIDSVSGALSKPSKSGQHSCTKMLLGTHRVAETTSSDCNRIYLRKKVKRSTPLSQKEMQNQSRFSAVAAAVKARKGALEHVASDRQAFLAQKDAADGKKTMKAYLWKVCGDAYDAQHPQG